MTKSIALRPLIVTDPSTLSVLGTEVQVFLDAAQTGGQYTAYRCVVPPNVGPPPHRHDGFDEAFYVLQGTFEILSGTETHRLEAGAYVFVPRGVVHTFRNVGEGPAIFLGTATPAGHEGFFEDADSLEGPLTPEVAVALCARHGIELVWETRDVECGTRIRCR